MEITENKLKDILTEQRTEFQKTTNSNIDKQRQEFQHIVGIFQEHLESQIQTIGEQLGSISEDIQIIKSDVEFIKVELKRKVDYDEFNALVKRVSLLEAKIRK